MGKLPPLPGRKPLRHSASTIDPSLLQDSATGRIFLLVDAFPWGMGAFQARRAAAIAKPLAAPAAGPAGLWLFCGRGRRHPPPDGSPTSLQGGRVPRNLEQKRQAPYGRAAPACVLAGQALGASHGKTRAHALVLPGARFQVFPTSYLFLLYSDDLGKTWSTPREINSLVKEDSLGFFGVCPGQGAQLSQGPHAGRLVFPAYALDAAPAGSSSGALYSDDGGSRWQAGTFAPLGEGISSMSETQLLPCPDGALLAFSRTTSGFVARTISLDGGATWQPPVLDSFLP